ncbi:MAG TPA: flavodoxin domain-containing protein [Nocardioidaceae bacterium]|nr:flavodoxin domain-containing protein [Nocardioidaceae bacterium]
MRILVAYASRHGATQVIATVVGHALEGFHHAVEIRPVEDVGGVEEYDAVVVGSAVYRRRWLPEATAFVEHHRGVLAGKPLWLFSSGPLGSGPAGEPVKGPGRLVPPRRHVVFPGALDPAELSLAERALRRTRAGRAALPAGDYRDWDEIRAWAGALGEDLRQTTRV